MRILARRTRSGQAVVETTHSECEERMPLGVGMWITSITCTIGSALQVLSNLLLSSYTTTSRFQIECINYAVRSGIFDGDQFSFCGFVTDQAPREQGRLVTGQAIRPL